MRMLLIGTLQYSAFKALLSLLSANVITGLLTLLSYNTPVLAALPFHAGEYELMLPRSAALTLSLSNAARQHTVSRSRFSRSLYIYQL